MRRANSSFTHGNAPAADRPHTVTSVCNRVLSARSAVRECARFSSLMLFKSTSNSTKASSSERSVCAVRGRALAITRAK